MAEGIISIREMQATMNADEIFSIEFVTYDKQRKKGGKIKSFPEAVQLNAKGIAGRAYTEVEAKRERKARHRDNYTRNIAICQEGIVTSMILCIHPELVLRFNNKEVLL